MVASARAAEHFGGYGAVCTAAQSGLGGVIFYAFGDSQFTWAGISGYRYKTLPTGAALPGNKSCPGWVERPVKTRSSENRSGKKTPLISSINYSNFMLFQRRQLAVKRLAADAQVSRGLRHVAAAAVQRLTDCGARELIQVLRGLGGRRGRHR